MRDKAMRFGGLIAGIAAAALLAGPGLASAEHGGGGGGGGHFSGGFGGGAHFSGGGAHFAGGGAHFRGGVRSGGFGGGAHFSAAPHYGYAARGFSTAPRFNASRGFAAAGGARIAGSSAWAGRGAWNGRGFRGVPGRTWFGPRWGFHPYWAGGWWGGYFWPRAYYGWAFPWFLAALPLGCAAYWWNGVPYYYVNSVYYVWNTDANGYVVADPPPVSGDVAPDSSADTGAPGQAASAPVAPAPDDVYMYPANGQSPQQQSTDRFECHKWAQDQTGFDPTQPNGGSGSSSPDDYHRAMIACLNGRGYSTQ